MNESANVRRCPQCGNAVPADAPHGLCPKCVLGGVDTPTVTSLPAGPLGLPPLEVIQEAFPQLEVMELIGQGGMGFVYKARQPNLDRLVALKILLPQLSAEPAFAERFSREARLLARLNHPNIVAVYDFGQSRGFFYLLMEFVEGVNLRQAMESGKFSPPEALALVPRICDALQFAHDDGVLHRDIKPENILLDTRGRVKIADFGIAKLVGEARDGLALTATGMAIGTPHYMAPEQLERPQDVDQRADIYSLGVVFYEMLTGELPIGRFAPPSEKSTVDPRVDAVVFRALERERERRYGTAGEVKTRLEDIRSTPRPAPAPVAGVDSAAAGSWRSDFILCNPRLPRLAQAIVIYGILVAPVLYLLGVLTSSSEPAAVLPSALAVQKGTLFLVGVGRLAGICVLLAGAFKLRGLRPDALRWLRLGFWLHIGMVALRVAGLAWAEALDGRAGTPAFTQWETVLAIVAVGAVAWEIACLVWLHRHAHILHPALGLPPPRTVAAHANAAAIWTALSLGVTAVVTGVFLAAPQVAAWRWGETLPLFRLEGVALLAVGGALLCGLKGVGAGWRALRELRSSRGQVAGIRRAVFGASAWPLVLVMGASTLCATLALMRFSLQGLAVILFCLVISFATGELILRGTWRWGMGMARGERSGPTPFWVHRWVLVGQLVAGVVVVPVGMLWLMPREAATPSHAAGHPAGAKPSGPSAAPSHGDLPAGEQGAGAIDPQAKGPSSAEGMTPTRGVDLEFTVPGGQVAVFEIVKRSSGVVVPVPDLAAYVIARQGAPATGSFRFLPALDNSEASPDSWKLELVSPVGRSRNSVNLPAALASIPGSISLKRKLEPDREIVLWAGDADDRDPNMGLRVRTEAHRLANELVADGSMTTNWLRAASFK